MPGEKPARPVPSALEPLGSSVPGRADVSEGAAPVPTPTSATLASAPLEGGPVEPPRQPASASASISRLIARLQQVPRVLRRAFEHPHAERARHLLLPVALLFGVCFFGYLVNQRYALKDWLFFRYAKSWLLVIYWFAGAMSGGYA